MKKLACNLLLMLLTFEIGFVLYRAFIPKVTLAQISENTSFYNGRTIEVETFLLARKSDESLWTITDFDESTSAVTVAYFENDSAKPDFLKDSINKDGIKQAKVLIKGKVLDNCNIDGRPTCCLFKAITIETQEVIQLEPVKDYSRPE